MNVVVVILSHILMFVLGGMLGAGGLFWLFARDPSVVRLRPGDVIVKEDVLEKLAKRAKARMQGRGEVAADQEEDDDDE